MEIQRNKQICTSETVQIDKEEHMFLVKLFTSALAAFLITFGYFDVWGKKMNKNAAPLGAMFISLWVVLTIAICVLSVAIGGISANVYSQEQLDEARQEAFEQGAAKAVSYVQDYISFEYCRDDWRRLSLGDEEIECEDADDLYSLFEYEAENTNSMYNALEELMKLKGAEIAQWNIELDK